MLRFALVKKKLLSSVRYLSTSLDNPAIFQTQAFLNGHWQSTEETFPLINPSTQEEIAQIANCGVGEYNNAINFAQQSFKTHRETSPRERSQILYNIYDLIQEHKKDLARLITLENGKPIKDSLGEIEYSASYFRWFAEEAPRIYGNIIPSSGSSKKQIFTIRQPLGVVGLSLIHI